MTIMLDIQQKRKFRSFLYHKITIFIFFVIVLFSIHSTWKVYEKKKESIVLLESSQKRLNELDERNNELDTKINKLNTDSGIEEEIRSKFSVAKDSENMVVIVNQAEGSSTATTTKRSFWGNFFNLFKRK